MKWAERGHSSARRAEAGAVEVGGGDGDPMQCSAVKCSVVRYSCRAVQVRYRYERNC